MQHPSYYGLKKIDLRIIVIKNVDPKILIRVWIGIISIYCKMLTIKDIFIPDVIPTYTKDCFV